MISSEKGPERALPTGREVPLAFRDDMRTAILEGRKICTSRNSCHAEPGDFFILGTIDHRRTWIITSVNRLNLDFVAHVLYSSEGFSSPKEFVDTWRQLYPKQGWDGRRLVFVHFFEEAKV